METVFKEEGVDFDSRLDTPNLTVSIVSRYVLTFLTVVSNVFDLSKGAEITAMNEELVAIEKRLSFSAYPE
jgi:hypothetical protein